MCTCDGTSVLMCVGGRNVSMWVVQSDMSSGDVKHWIVAQSITFILCVTHFKHFKC